MKRFISILISVILLFTLWHIAYNLENHEVIIPSISSTFNEILNIISSDNFITIILTTTIRTIIGFLLSLILGVILGIISGIYKNFEDFLKPYIILMRSTPTVAIILLALIYLKSNTVPIFVNFLVCFPIIYQEVITGIRNADTSILEFAKVHKISTFTLVKYVYIPSMLSHVFSGILSTISLGFKITISSEILSIPKFGIGSSIYNAKVYLNTAEVFAWIIIILSICLFLDYTLTVLKRYLSKGGKSCQ